MTLLRNLFSWKEVIERIQKPPADTTKVCCPYSHCANELPQVPARSKKCPHCKEYIVARTHYYTKQRILLTSAEAEGYDEDRKDFKHFRRFLKGLIEFLYVDESWLFSLYQEHVQMLKKRSVDEPRLAAVVESIAKHLATSNPSVAAMVQFQQAIFLYETGKEYQHIRAQSFVLELEAYKKLGHEKIQIITHEEKSCPACMILDKKVMTISEALAKQPLPCKKCTFSFNGSDLKGWCRCFYSLLDTTNE